MPIMQAICRGLLTHQDIRIIFYSLLSKVNNNVRLSTMSLKKSSSRMKYVEVISVSCRHGGLLNKQKRIEVILNSKLGKGMHM